MGEVIPFPKQPEKVDFEDLYLALSNHFDNTNDSREITNKPEVISRKKAELVAVGEKIKDRIDNITDLRPTLPSPTEFQDAAERILHTVFHRNEHGEERRVALDHYNYHAVLESVMTHYANRYRELAQNQFDGIAK